MLSEISCKQIMYDLYVEYRKQSDSENKWVITRILSVSLVKWVKVVRRYRLIYKVNCFGDVKTAYRLYYY